MLDPRLLRSFVAIADTGSFSQAAGRLNMTQSTISQQLARLEESVGLSLVDRGARPVQATASGERLLCYARRILALQDEAVAVVGDPAGTVSIRIGVPEDIASEAMEKVFAAFAKRHREIRLDVTAGLSRDLTKRYRAGEFDIVVVKEPAANADCRAAFPEAMAWFESIDAPDAWPDPVPLVAFPSGGLYRDAMSSASSVSSVAGISPSRAAASTTCLSQSKQGSGCPCCRLGPRRAATSGNTPDLGWSLRSSFLSIHGTKRDPLLSWSRT